MESLAAINILCTKITPRLEYVAHYLSTVARLTFTVTQTPDHQYESVAAGSCLINYGVKPIDGAFNIFAAGLLLENGIGTPEPGVILHQGRTMLFPAPEGFDLPFDLFSAVFYLLTRYEEYLPYKPDLHSRFEADQSLAFRNNFLEEPVVDQWLEMLKANLILKYPGLNFPGREFRFVSTFDIDSPWAYLHKGVIRTAGGLLKDTIGLNTRELRLRLNVLRRKSADPYDTYEYIRQTEQKYGFRSLFFILLGNYGRYDTNFAWETVPFRNLLNSLKSEGIVGIHPSYRSNRDTSILNLEFERFTRLAGKKPEISRQHFLMLKLPYTYRQLIKLGIQEDYSMGYASCPGFRAGTSRPFLFYDLVDESETRLLIHPFLVMDVTLQQYLNLNSKESLNRINSLIKKTKAVNGTFTSLWHNESLSECGVWKGWRKVYEGMLKKVTRDEGRVTSNE
jgi:hypothetical protein